ncbi:protein CHROMOSOME TRANSMISSION FIDELITY 7 [Aristolochia californica]|uniref:protein CHROMOSOME TRANSMISSION FIDELITY 7 n=1 Tax=Aristolochia californica TaxID=171875 RepID=UPI0035DFFB23
MQSKISTFFKPSQPKVADESFFAEDFDKDLLPMEDKKQEILVTYKRRIPNTTSKRNDYDRSEICGQVGELHGNQSEPSSASDSPSASPSMGRILNKKRRYAQYHLELGQSDFLLHTCSICGIKYTRGDNMDEKVHDAFHKNYSEGVQFKGWPYERLISAPSASGDRIILVLSADPPFQRHKVQEVLQIMERYLGLSCGWLLHKLCKVYLFISCKRIVGALVAEPIRTAHRIISNLDRITEDTSELSPACCDGNNVRPSKMNSTVLQFGPISFQREAIKRVSSYTNEQTPMDKGDGGAVICEKETVPAICGIRAIWVLPSSRRKKIATRLLDTLRKTFCKGSILEPTQCAFSQPTSAGRAFASSYCCTESFLVYHASADNS